MCAARDECHGTSRRTTPSQRPASGARPKSTGETTRHAGYTISQTCRKAIECIFGWGKQHGTMAKYRGAERVEGGFVLNLRIPILLTA